MTNIIDLDSRRPHRFGHQRCTACGYSGEIVVALVGIPEPFECSRCRRLSAVWSSGKRHVRWDARLERWVERLFNYTAEWWYSPGYGWGRITVQTCITGRAGDDTGSARA